MSARLKHLLRVATAVLLLAGIIVAATGTEHQGTTKQVAAVATWNGKTISAHDALLEVHLQEKAAAELAAQQQRALQEAEAARLAQIAKARAARAARIRPVQPSVIGDDVWSALARCESGGRPTAVSRSGKYFGAFQFSLATWRGIGMTGNPIDYPYEVQLGAAKRLQARSGWGQWPTCSRKLGLR